ncbi:MAG: histidine triad nucleotide-binding protein [Deltaproteobacteria bacterium CG07_land_8_20_14_0_80_38_7]|nr:MAG: histidine triad nucleotide-binding protein [Deltaproteobacteria bacterium CG07_land_8_20_14_0_80_38_7]
MHNDCIFCKIVSGSISSEKVYEDDDVFAFRDINPVAPTHILVIPKEHFSTLNDIPENKLNIISKIYSAIQKIAKKEGIAESGYRTIVNTNSMSGQVVFHLHFHVLGGRQLRGLG